MTLKLINATTRQATIKRVSRNLTVSTLQALVTKLLHANDLTGGELELRYIDNENNIQVVMDNLNKSLNYYSIEDGNSVMAEWK